MYPWRGAGCSSTRGGGASRGPLCTITTAARAAGAANVKRNNPIKPLLKFLMLKPLSIGRKPGTPNGRPARRGAGRLQWSSCPPSNRRGRIDRGPYPTPQLERTVSDEVKAESGGDPRGGVRETLHRVLAQLRAEPGRLAALLDETPEALVAFDANRNILHVNARAAAVFGYPAAELTGRSTDVLLPARLRQPDAPPMRATEDLMQVELPGLMRDGQERVSSWNTGAARSKGWTTAEIIGQPYESFFTPEDRAAGVPRSLMADALRDGSREVTGWRMRKNGSRFWMQGSLTLLRGPDGNIAGFAKVTRDLTEKRNAEENERRLLAERAAREAAPAAEQQLRDGEDRLRRLQHMPAALSQAATPVDGATVVLREGSNALCASGG